MLEGTDYRTSALASVLGLTALVSLVFGLEFQLAPSAPPPAPTRAPAPVPAAVAKPSPGLLVPVAGIDRGDLTRQFDERRSGGRSHQAIDILAPLGTPVLAANDGLIERLTHNRLGGITLYQRDPARGFVYYYAHLQRYRPGLREGDEVRKGEVIGYVGSTGNAPPDAPHLHFAITRQGEPIDPYDELVVSRLATR
jgi:murein DD-endopeptidase MepM/ murein hydrolase activator NlpD